MNKRTTALRLGLVAAGAPAEVATKPPRLQPLEFLLSVMADESQSIATRIDAAKSLLPYTNFRKGLVDTSGRDVPLTVNIIRFSDVADELETMDRLAEPRPVTIEHDPQSPSVPPASH